METFITSLLFKVEEVKTIGGGDFPVYTGECLAEGFVRVGNTSLAIQHDITRAQWNTIVEPALRRLAEEVEAGLVASLGLIPSSSPS